MSPPEDGYDVVVIGSGNGACGFLRKYLERAPQTARVVVLEEGRNFFYTSDITHQNAWTKSYSEGGIFVLHDARTSRGLPIISGRAKTMGGGGSINYTMLHESSRWLARHLGRDPEYWDQLKAELNAAFERPDPRIQQTPITRRILDAGRALGYEPVDDFSLSNISSYGGDFCDDEKKDDDDDTRAADKQLYQFPTQFDAFGQRTRSGVSIVDWDDPRLDLKTRVAVEELVGVEGSREDSPEDRDTALPNKRVSRIVAKGLEGRDKGKRVKISVKPDTGKVVLCAGAATPRILLESGLGRGAPALGANVSDHILLPLPLYVPGDKIDVSPKDVYAPVFATTVWRPSPEKRHGSFDASDARRDDAVVVSVDFFAGTLQKLLYLTSHLYLAFLPNFLKSAMLRRPWLFALAKNFVRTLVSVVDILISLLYVGKTPPEFVTGIIKYNPAAAGRYETTDSSSSLTSSSSSPNSRKKPRGKNDTRRITLGWFDDPRDKLVAKAVVRDTLPLMERLGDRPPRLVRWLYRLVTRVPYDASQVDAYVDHYSDHFLLSEQHMAGGCLLGDALDRDTGKLQGAANVHVADLSAVPLPRVSPQMTAYLVGFHVATHI